jgi:hypothetical protein
MRYFLLALGAVAALAACGAGRASLPPAATTSQFAATNIVAPSGAKGRLTVTIAIAKPALNADTLTIRAYVLPAGGPLAAPPASSLVATIDVAKASKQCGATAGGRSCTFSVRAPLGTDAIVAVLTAKKNVVAQGFTKVAVAASATLALDAGTVPIEQLAIVSPLAIVGRAFNVGVTALANDGSTIMLSPSKQPITVRVYGPSGVVPSPQATAGGTGVTAAFAYSGTAFVNPMTMTAVTGTMSNTAQIFPKATAPMACAPLSNTPALTVAEPTIYPAGFNLHASIAGSKIIQVGLDTGSTTFAVSSTNLSGVQKSQMIGPGQSAHITYEPSGTTISGNYYLARVTIYGNGTTHRKLGTTVPMEVFVVTSNCVKGEATPCPPGKTAYMGVGFGRPSPSPAPSPPLGVMQTPLESVFAQLTQVVQGSMHPGFGLTPTRLTIGVNSASATGFTFAQLAAYPNRPGDWQGPRACVRFSNAGKYRCGHMLLDIGINTMFMNVPQAPSNPTSIEIVAPNAQNPLLQYSFAYPVQPHASPPSPSQPFTISNRSPIFVNTGRDALAATNFLYDAGCGRAGFKT